MNKQDAINFAKCVKNNITIYPKPIEQTHFKIKPQVKLIVNNNGKEAIGKIILKQDEEMTKKILELYKIISSRI